MKRFISPQFWTGAFVTALGMTVVLGWMLRIPWMVQVRPDFVAMVLNTAICFTLTGVALILDASRSERIKKAIPIFGMALIILAGAVVSQLVLRVDLGVDLPKFHDWLIDGNASPGRMAPNTALAFLLTGLVLVITPRVTSKTQGAVIQIATFLVLLLGLTGLVGYSLQLELLYGWAKATRMAVHTAVGVSVVGLGLWASWHKADWYASRTLFRDDERIAFVSAAILIVVGLTAGVAGLAAQQSALESSLSSALSVDLENRAAVFHSEIAHAIANAQTAADRPNFKKLVASLGTNPRDQDTLRDLDTVAKTILATGMNGLLIRDRSGDELARFGRFSAPTDAAKELGTLPASSLLFGDRLLLKVTVPIVTSEGPAGEMVSEQPLPVLDLLVFTHHGLGKTGETGLCFAGPNDLVCYPQLRNPKVYHARAVSVNGLATPMALAVQGKTGIFKGLDYRGNHVIAAHMPLQPYGLGMVIKKDASELFLPIRNQLRWAVPLLLALVVGGAFLVRRQVSPLAARLLASERDAISSELRIRTVVESVGDGVVTLDQAGTVRGFNRTASEIFGYSEIEALGKNITELMPEGMRAAHRQGLSNYLAGGPAKIINKGHVRVPGLRKGGEVFPMELAINELFIDGSREFVGIIRDISERESAERMLFSEKERLRVTLASIGDAVITTDVDGKITYLNGVAEQLTGWENEEAVGQALLRVFNIVEEKTDKPAVNPVEVVLRDNVTTGLAHDTLLIQRNGERLAIEDSAAPIRDIDGNIVGVVLVFHDVTKARLLAQKISHQAAHDELTGLANRAGFALSLAAAMADAKKGGYVVALALLDLDDFKPINDSLGHAAGDQVLQQVAARLRDSVRPSDSIARLGGDEFVLMLPNLAYPADAEVVARKVIAQIAKPMRVEGHDLVVTASIGISVYPQDGSDATLLLKAADAAMYRAKRAGRNRYAIYIAESGNLDPMA